MELKEFLAELNSGAPVKAGGEVHGYMHLVSQEALKVTARINGSYHTPEELFGEHLDIIYSSPA